MRTLITAVLILAFVRDAAADDATDAINDLQTSTTASVRISASVELARLGDPRGIPVLADTLIHDRNPDVRDVAALALGKIVTSSSSAADRQTALLALDRASRIDRNRRVRRDAQQSRGKLLAFSPPKTGTYVEVAPVTAPNRPAGIAAQVSRSITKVIARQPGVQSVTPGKGYEVDATVTGLTATRRGGTIGVVCTVQIAVKDHPATRVLATFQGRASVVASSKADVVPAAEDCVYALSGALMPRVFAMIMRRATTVTSASTASTAGSQP